MKKYLFFLFSLLMSCTELIDPPKNLVPKETMSELVAQFALNDQINNYLPNTNIENVTRTVLKEKKVSSTDFTESYKYYTASGELDEILTKAQEIILDKDPAAKAYIEKKLKENQNVPTFAR